jgi:hypothetical protein
MTGAPSILAAALSGRPVDRPLLAPLFAALAADVEELDLRAFLADAGKRSRLYADLCRSLPVDVLVVDSGSGWDAEAAGFVLDWDGGYPPRLRARAPGARDFDPARGGAPVIVDLLARVRAVVPPDTALGVTVTGPATLAAASGGSLTLPDAVAQALHAARTVAQAGAGVVFVREDASVPVDAAEYIGATTPLWGSLTFFRTAGVLKLCGAADGWAPVVAAPGPFLPCFDSHESPAVSAAMLASERPFAIGLEASGVPVEAVELLHTGRCALVTHVEDLAGRIPVRDVQGAVARMATGGPAMQDEPISEVQSQNGEHV